MHRRQLLPHTIKKLLTRINFNRMKKCILSCALLAGLLCGCKTSGVQSFKTDYFQVDVDSKGYIVGMWNRTKTDRNFSPNDRPSPLLSLYNSKHTCYYYPRQSYL